MPSALGIGQQCEKGDFPYLLSAYENEGKVWDSLQPLSYYNTEALKPKRRKELEQWHAANRRKVFDYDHEIIKYCENDVECLTRCVMAFRNLFLSITIDNKLAPKGICPFYKSFTMAGACNRVFRQLFLPQNSLALLHQEDEKRRVRVNSEKALKWLKFLNTKDNLTPPIQHSRNGGEVVLLGKPVDGYREVDGVKHVFEFYGCFFHGHEKHITRSTTHPYKKCSMGYIYDLTMLRLKRLRDNGYSVTTMWECEFDELVKQDPSMQAAIDSLHVDQPLDPRAALAGGRTNAIKLYHKVSEDESIRYYDIKVNIYLISFSPL